MDSTPGRPATPRDAQDPDLFARFERALIPTAPATLLFEQYSKSAGQELVAKFFSPESSSALAANAFGYFASEPSRLPPLPRLTSVRWPAEEVQVECAARFPWTGGRHPCLDVMVRAADALIGVESKRFEPFRPHKVGKISPAYDRDMWGSDMGGYLSVRDEGRRGSRAFKHLDAVQLMKHALGLRTQARRDADEGRTPVLYYLYDEPESWYDGTPLDKSLLERHRAEIAEF